MTIIQPKYNRGILSGALRGAVLLGVLSSGALANDRSDSPAAPPILGKFTIGKGGRPILLPVEVKGEPVTFLLDTGASCSVIDITLRDSLGESRGTRTLQTSAGPARVKIYDWPEATIGSRTLRPEASVACFDLSYLRRAANADVSGVIGMDLLEHCRVYIDFDQGFVRFFDSFPKDRGALGTRIRLQMGEDHCPRVVASMASGAIEEFQIDTGADSCSIEGERFDELLEHDVVLQKSSFVSSTAVGAVRSERGRLRSMTIGPFTQQGIRVSRLGPSALGLRFLSRFRVTFDFPGNAIYLYEGQQYGRPEPSATSGLALNWVAGEIRVQGVQKDGPGEHAGIRANDVLIEIDGRPSNKFDAFELRQVLTSKSGRRVPIKIQRGERELDMTVVLDDD